MSWIFCKKKKIFTFAFRNNPEALFFVNRIINRQKVKPWGCFLGVNVAKIYNFESYQIFYLDISFMPQRLSNHEHNVMGIEMPSLFLP